jgi:predicted small secreted protein
MTPARLALTAAVFAAALSTAACETKTGKGATIGAAGGAAVGLVTGNPLAGAAVGAVGGAVTGAIITDAERQRGCTVNSQNQKVCPK